MWPLMHCYQALTWNRFWDDTITILSLSKPQLICKKMDLCNFLLKRSPTHVYPGKKQNSNIDVYNLSWFRDWFLHKKGFVFHKNLCYKIVFSHVFRICSNYQLFLHTHNGNILRNDTTQKQNYVVVGLYWYYYHYKQSSILLCSRSILSAQCSIMNMHGALIFTNLLQTEWFGRLAITVGVLK